MTLVADACRNMMAAPSVAGGTRLNKQGVQALYMGGVVYIQGTNESTDWGRYNLDLAAEGHSGAKWHAGFLNYARIVHDWIKTLPQMPTLIVGYSLGAAAAQIVSASFGIPAICFGSPRPLRSPRDKLTLPTRQILLVRHPGDRITRLPFNSGHGLGMIIWRNATRNTLQLKRPWYEWRPNEHRLSHYLKRIPSDAAWRVKA